MTADEILWGSFGKHSLCSSYADQAHEHIETKATICGSGFYYFHLIIR